jgi:hypothetical protein
MDELHCVTGYFCRACRRREFAKAQALTLVFGWWGVVALLVRNPISIIGNFKSLVRAPLFAAEYGAIQLDDQSRSRALAGALFTPTVFAHARASDSEVLDEAPVFLEPGHIECPHCGFSVSDNFKHCPKCRQPLPEPSAAPVETTVA